MSDPILAALHEIRDLIRLSAKPAIDSTIVELRKVTGGSEKKMMAVVLMDGSRTKAEIAKTSGYDKSDLTKLVKALDAMNIMSSGDSNPKLLFPVTIANLKGGTDDGK